MSNVQQIVRNLEEARSIRKIQMEMQNAQKQNANLKKKDFKNLNEGNNKNLHNTNNYDNNNNKNNNINDNCTNSEYLNEKEIKFAFSLFSENTIYFAYLDRKTSELKFCLMRDLYEPFSPVAQSALFMPFSKLLNQSFCESLNEKLTNFLISRNNLNTNNDANYSKNAGTAFSASLIAGADNFSSTAEKKTYNHLHIFTCNKNICGSGFFPESEYIKKYSSENEIKLFLQEASVATLILDKMLSKDVTLNCFVCGFTQANYLEMQVNLPTFFDVCSKTGGRGFYYSIINKPERFNEDVKVNYQKLHYDLSAVLNKKVYYDIRISLKHSSEFDISDVFYSVGNSVNRICTNSAFNNIGGNLLGLNSDKNKGAINLPSVNTDFNMLFNFKYSKTLKEGRKYCFQFIVEYIDPEDDNARKIRVFNYGLFPNEIFFKVYSYLDIDAMVKLIFAKEIADSLTEKNKNVCCFEKVKENLKKRLIDALFFYKKNVSELSLKIVF